MELNVQKLRSARKCKKITAQELADKMGISRVTLGAWETAKRMPSEAKIRMLATVLEISVCDISDLEPYKAISKINIAPVTSGIISVIHGDQERNLYRQRNLLSGMMNMIKELADAKMLIKVLISSLPSIFYIKGPDLKYIAASQSFLDNLSLPGNFDVIGKTDYDFFPENEARLNSESDEKVLSDGLSIQGIEGHIPGNRKTKWGIMSKIPILDSESGIQGVVGYFTDITAHQKAEDKYNRIVNFSPNPICVIGLDRYFKFINPAWEKVLGYPPKEMLGQPFTNFIHPDDRAQNEIELDKAAAAGTSLDFENRFLHKDGSIRYLKWTSAPINGDKQLYCIVTDITERKLAKK